MQGLPRTRFERVGTVCLRCKTKRRAGERPHGTKLAETEKKYAGFAAEADVSEKDAAMSRLPYLGNLSDTQRRYLAEHAAIRRYAKGETVHGYGSTCLGAITVIKGSLRVYILSEEGREITLFELKEGDSCVLSMSCVTDKITFDTHMKAESDCELLVISASAFGKVAEDNVYVRCFMHEVATERFSAVMRTMQKLLFEGMERRLADFLLEEYARSADKVVRLTHEEIAVKINSAREVVARTLKRFENEGLVELGRGRVVLKDIGALESV